MTNNYCKEGEVICQFENPRIQVKLVRAQPEETNKELYHVLWKSHLGTGFTNVLKKPTNYRDASELYFDMTNTCLKSTKRVNYV